MSGLTCQQIVFVTKLVLGLNRSAVCALGSAHTLSVQKGSLRYPALFDFAAVLHNEMDVIAASNNHENGPQTGVRLTYGGLSGPLQARAA